MARKYKLTRGDELKLSAAHGNGKVTATFKATGPAHFLVVEVGESDLFAASLEAAIADGTIVPLT
jgi:hypothetical protein